VLLVVHLQSANFSPRALLRKKSASVAVTFETETDPIRNRFLTEIFGTAKNAPKLQSALQKSSN